MQPSHSISHSSYIWSIIHSLKSVRMNDEVLLNSSLSLRGWFRKEKQDKKFKKHKLSPSSNRRWFQIQHVETKLALCYYKRMPKEEKDQPNGFFFLNEITSVTQDIPKRLIVLEHPTRELRMESPSLSQHKHWYSELVKFCPNANAHSGTRNGASSHSFYARAPSSTSTSFRESASMSVDGAATNQLNFLPEITSGNAIAPSASSSDSGILDPSVSTTESEKENVAPEYEEEKTELQPLSYRGNGKQDDSGEKLLDQMNKELTLVRHGSLLSTASNDIPNRSASFGSHQIPTSSSFRLHFGDDDVQPDDDFLCDDWDD